MLYSISTRLHLTYHVNIYVMTTSRKISSFSVIPFLFCNLLLLCHVNIKVPDFRLATHIRIRLLSGLLFLPPLQISLSLSSHLLCPAELPLRIDYALLDELADARPGCPGKGPVPLLLHPGGLTPVQGRALADQLCSSLHLTMSLSGTPRLLL